MKFNKIVTNSHGIASNNPYLLRNSKYCIQYIYVMSVILDILSCYSLQRCRTSIFYSVRWEWTTKTCFFLHNGSRKKRSFSVAKSPDQLRRDSSPECLCVKLVFLTNYIIIDYEPIIHGNIDYLDQKLVAYSILISTYDQTGRLLFFSMISTPPVEALYFTTTYIWAQFLFPQIRKLV